MSFYQDGATNGITKMSEKNTDNETELFCYLCDTPLDLEYDYSCIVCGNLTCDNHNDVCQEEDEDGTKGCDLVTCSVCLKRHTRTQHPDSEENGIIKTSEEDTGKETELFCYLCDTPLDLKYDYSCIVCGNLTCDNHNDVCQEEDEDGTKGCDLVTCSICLKRHTRTQHPDSAEMFDDER